jgi:hypothetical protein
MKITKRHIRAIIKEANNQLLEQAGPDLRTLGTVLANLEDIALTLASEGRNELAYKIRAQIELLDPEPQENL